MDFRKKLSAGLCSLLVLGQGAWAYSETRQKFEVPVSPVEISSLVGRLEDVGQKGVDRCGAEYLFIEFPCSEPQGSSCAIKYSDSESPIFLEKTVNSAADVHVQRILMRENRERKFYVAKIFDIRLNLNSSTVDRDFNQVIEDFSAKCPYTLGWYATVDKYARKLSKEDPNVAYGIIRALISQAKAD